MTTKTLYKYIGRNGSVTTPILLDGINHIKLVELRAEAGYVVTNGKKSYYAVTVEADKAEEWYEVIEDILD